MNVKSNNSNKHFSWRYCNLTMESGRTCPLQSPPTIRYIELWAGRRGNWPDCIHVPVSSSVSHLPQLHMLLELWSLWFRGVLASDADLLKKWHEKNGGMSSGHTQWPPIWFRSKYVFVHWREWNTPAAVFPHNSNRGSVLVQGPENCRKCAVFNVVFSRVLNSLNFWWVPYNDKSKSKV